MFHSERRAGSYPVTMALATLVEVLLTRISNEDAMDTEGEDGSALPPSILHAVVPWTKFLMHRVLAEFGSWRHQPSQSKY